MKFAEIDIFDRSVGTRKIDIVEKTSKFKFDTDEGCFGWHFRWRYPADNSIDYFFGWMRYHIDYIDIYYDRIVDLFFRINCEIWIFDWRWVVYVYWYKPTKKVYSHPYSKNTDWKRRRCRDDGNYDVIQIRRRCKRKPTFFVNRMIFWTISRNSRRLIAFFIICFLYNITSTLSINGYLI